MKINIYYIIPLLLLLLWGCEDYYIPELETAENALVVECQMTDREENVMVNLSRTVPFNGRSYFSSERKAIVYIKAASGAEFITREVSNGHYQTIEKIKPVIGEGYYVHIQTSDALEYKSEVEIMMPPTDIESIHLTDTISREINTDYWGNPYISDFKGINFSVLPKTPSDKNVGFLYKWNALVNYFIEGAIPPSSFSFYCWKTMTSSTIFVYDYNESESNNELILDDLHFLSYYGLSPQPIDSSRFYIVNKITKRKELIPIVSAHSSSFYYRVRQYTVTKKGAEFWKGVKRQTEASGKLFDPVEEQLTTNIYCVTDASVPAYGYFNTAAYTEKIIKLTLKPGGGFEKILDSDIIPIPEENEDCLLGEKPDFWY